MTPYEYITVEIIDRKGIITLNRPDKRNAFHPGLVSEFKEILRLFVDDDRVKIMILKANGEAFSAGADLGYLQNLQNFSFDDNLADSGNLAELFELIYTHPKIIIAQIEGHALAGGCGLATICDFSFAIPGIKMGYTEVKIGFIPAIVMVFLLRKLSGNIARELLLSGKIISSEEALHAGLINAIYSRDEISEKVNQFADTLCREVSAQAMATTKKMLAEIPGMPLKEALSFAALCNARARASEDCKKGIAAFLHKDKISW